MKVNLDKIMHRKMSKKYITNFREVFNKQKTPLPTEKAKRPKLYSSYNTTKMYEIQPTLQESSYYC